eukprot:Hpha_TRINITY_DN6781_c0_g1::TRINITY_DN6781_c0_g1_i1::g.110906::m.110906/K20872/NEK2; NIMA (never in mitosis gene a)-related kinase 2
MDAYEVLEELGVGSFGRVARIRRKSDGRLFVWKELDYGKMSDTEKQLIVSEVNLLRGFRHPYIVRYYDRLIDRSTHRIYIIMEWCDHGDLAALIRRHRRSSTHAEEKHVWRVFLQLALALAECHQRKEGKVLHRDIKPANVFLDRDNNVKLGDFGLARVLSDRSEFAHTRVGTPYYMSPEQIDEMAYDEKSDVWSLGCVVYELCANVPPFQASNQLSLAVKIRAGKYRPLPELFSAELREAVARCLTVDPKQRPSVAELLALPCFAVRLKEKQLSNQFLELRRRDDEIGKRTDELRSREEELRSREEAIAARERAAAELERSLREREAALSRCRCRQCGAPSQDQTWSSDRTTPVGAPGDAAPEGWSGNSSVGPPDSAELEGIAIQIPRHPNHARPRRSGSLRGRAPSGVLQGARGRSSSSSRTRPLPCRPPVLPPECPAL